MLLSNAVRWANRLNRWWHRRDVAVWYDPLYRLPLAGLQAHVGMEPRRADFAAWYLVDRRVVPSELVFTPEAVSYADLARVHTPEYLESLGHVDKLAEVFSVNPGELQVDEVMHSMRLACGGTLAATRHALRTGQPAMNLLGGFHHAWRDRGGGFCPVNDVAVAIAAVRASGFRGQIVVLDLDAHPPDGLADCLQYDPATWLGSISGADWGPLPCCDETVLPSQTGDAEYLEALDDLLERMPKPALAFVIAGGDVLAGDRFGGLSLTLDGARRRDLRLAEQFDDVPSVWVPGGGYNERGWRVLAGTAIALALRSARPIREGYDPLQARFAAIAGGLDAAELTTDEFDTDDIAQALGLRGSSRPQLLGYYTAEGIEFALYRYGVLDQIGRLGYRSVRVEVDQVELGDRLRLFAQDASGREHVVFECVLERRRVSGVEMLYVHWLTLRHPLATFDERRPALPGQDAPGLGLAREAGEMLERIARRLGLPGVAFRPSWYHMAFTARSRFRFVDPARQGRFEALVRDLRRVPLLQATLAVSERRVLLNGEPYTWEADEMANWLDEAAAGTEDAALTMARKSSHFTLVPAPAASTEERTGAEAG